jgi:hypothetical protein
MVEDNGLRICRGFSYNPNVFRNRMFPGERFRVGLHRNTEINARNLSEEKPE